MGMRRTLGGGLEATLGKQRTDRIRKAERRVRQGLSDRLAPAPVRGPGGRGRQARSAAAAPARGPKRGAKARPLGEPNDRQGGWVPPDPFVEHPKPSMSRHALLRELHGLLTPRTYLEIGVNTGASLALSRAKSIGIDPEFAIRHGLHCDLDLVKSKSDELLPAPRRARPLRGHADRPGVHRRHAPLGVRVRATS